MALSIVIKIDDPEDIEELMAAGAEDLGDYFLPNALKLNSAPRSVLLKNVPNGNRYQLEWQEDLWERDKDG